MSRRVFQLTLIAFAFSAIACGCNRSQAPADEVAGLRKLDPANYSSLPNPEPPADYAALTGVSDTDAPNGRLLGWLGHLDPEDTDRDPITIDFAAIESLQNGAETFDCGPYIFDDSLRDALRNAPKLKWLRAGRKTTSSDLEWICELTALRGLCLKDANLTDANLAQLGSLAELQWLVLGGASLPKNGSLPELPNLESLHMRYCNIGDSYSPATGQFPKLRAVSLADTDVTDNGIAQLVLANPEIRYLHLFGCDGVTSKSAAEIGKLKNLRYTHLGYTPLSRDLYENWAGGDGLQRLQILIPKCYIGIGS